MGEYVGRVGVRERERERERLRLTQPECFCISNSFHSHYPAILSRPQVVYHCELLMAASKTIMDKINISASPAKIIIPLLSFYKEWLECKKISWLNILGLLGNTCIV